MTGARPYLLEISQVLWPAADEAPTAQGRTPRPRKLLAVPSARTPSLLLPAGRAASAAAVRAYGGHGTLLNRTRTGATAVLFSLGLGRLAFRDTVTVDDGEGSISAELSRILGRTVQVAVRGGPARANRKPVLAVLDDDGTLLAFAKLGTTALAQDLVRVEGAALERLAPVLHGTVRVPRVIHHGIWRGMDLLVQEALPVRRSRPLTEQELLSAVAEIGRSVGCALASWGASEHADVVRQRLARAPGTSATAELRAVVAVLADVSLPVALGAWHGDLTPWNCATSSAGVVVWDWERFSTGVPVGFDVLHYDLQSALARTERPSVDLPRALLAGAADRLRPLGVQPDTAQVIAVAYLIEIATRYLVDDQAGAGARAGSVESWLLPVLNEEAAALGSAAATSDRGVSNV